MAKFRAEFVRDFQMIVDDETDIGAFGDRQNFFGHGANFFGRRIFCAQLDQVAATVAKLLRDGFWRATMQIRGVNECVELAIRERFHSPQFWQNRRECSNANRRSIVSRTRNVFWNF
jgi:hypothetical protein